MFLLRIIYLNLGSNTRWAPSAGLKTCGLLEDSEPGLYSWREHAQVCLLVVRAQRPQAENCLVPWPACQDCLSECPRPHHRHHPPEKWICCNQWTYTNTSLSSKVHSSDSILILYIMWVWMAIHMGTFSIIEWSISAFPMLLIKHIKHVLYTWHYSKSLRYVRLKKEALRF